MLKDVFKRKSHVTFFPPKMLPFVFSNLICFGTFWVVTVMRVFLRLWQAGAALCCRAQAEVASLASEHEL